jgi:hypothetical protein
VLSSLEALVDRSSRRRGQSLVVVGAFLGALSGVILGLAVGDPQPGTAVAAPAHPSGAAEAATLSASQPTASQPSGSGDRADGGEPTRRPAEHPGRTTAKPPKDGKEPRKDGKQSGGHANGKPGKGDGEERAAG